MFVTAPRIKWPAARPAAAVFEKSGHGRNIRHAQKEWTVQEESEDLRARWNSVVRRRAFLKGLGVAGALLPTSGLLAAGVKAAGTKANATLGGLTAGDAAILRFL